MGFGLGIEPRRRTAGGGKGDAKPVADRPPCAVERGLVAEHLVRPSCPRAVVCGGGQRDEHREEEDE